MPHFIPSEPKTELRLARNNDKLRFALVLVLLLPCLSIPQTFAAGGSSNNSTSSVADANKDLKLVKRLIYKEKYKRALKKLNTMVEKNEHIAETWNLLGFASRKTNDFDTADMAYKKALELNSNHLGALEYQGELYISMGKLALAKSNLEKLNQLCPSGCDEQQALAEALEAANQ